MNQSNLIFIGTAEKVAYRNARGDKGEGVIPYTIVTYRIDQVLRGKAPGKESIQQASTSLAVRIFGHHALAVGYILAHREAHYSNA